MGQPARHLTIAVLLLLGAGLFATLPVGAASQPSIGVSVNGESVADGDRVVVPEANLSVSVTGDVELDSVIVRIDGEEYHEAQPNGTSSAVELDPDFSTRSNAVEVIVTDAAGNLSNHQITVYRDTLAPDIGLSSPFEVSPGYQFPSKRAFTSADVELVGTVRDASNVTDFSAKLVGSGQSVETTELEDGAFALDTTLAPGNNSLIVTATDEYGFRIYRSTRIEVTDDADPALEIRGWSNRTEAATIRPTIVANDSVAVNSLVVQLPGQPEQTVVEPTTKLLDSGRTSVTVRPELTFHRAGTYNVTFNVTDTAGNWVEETREIEYDPVTTEERIAPEIRIDGDRSGMIDESGYRLFANVTDGTVREIALESNHRWEGVTHLETLYTGSNVTSYVIDAVVDIEPGRNVILIEVIDALGRTHETEFEVDTANASSYQPPTTQQPETTQAVTTQNQNSTDPPATQNTPAETTILVNEPTPLTPVTETSSPLSPLIPVVAFVLVGLLLWRTRER
ncbi:MAG: hypothetical protein U5K70_09670 [Halodesulfurarchaeum sp.]|nr:hypothetical protein [Halodesulfurarchaeum sp.]